MLRRRAGSIRARLLEHSKRKTKQAERMLGNAAALSSSAKKKSKEAELMSKDNAKVRFTTTALLTTALWPSVLTAVALSSGIHVGDLTDSSRKRSHWWACENVEPLD